MAIAVWQGHLTSVPLPQDGNCCSAETLNTVLCGGARCCLATTLEKLCCVDMQEIATAECKMAVLQMRAAAVREEHVTV